MKTIEVNNKLIAEFMGYEILYRPYSNGFIEISDTEICDVDDLDLSWELLMKVVDKIEGLGYSYDRINADVFINTQEGENIIPNPMDGNTMTMRQKTLKVIIEFIKFYNNKTI